MNSFRIRQSKGFIVEGEVGVGADVAQHYVERTCKVLRQSKQQVARVWPFQYHKRVYYVNNKNYDKYSRN